MQPLAAVSPVTYGLEGTRAALQDGAGVVELWGSIWPLLIMGVVFVLTRDTSGAFRHRYFWPMPWPIPALGSRR